MRRNGQGHAVCIVVLVLQQATMESSCIKARLHCLNKNNAQGP